LLSVGLNWRVTNTVPLDTVKVFVQVLDPGGQLIAQEDRPLSEMRVLPATEVMSETVVLPATLAMSNTVTMSETVMGTPVAGYKLYGILLPTTLASGPHQLIVGLYDPGQAGSPRILTVDGRDHVVVAELQPE
jgi:hypothetical protein